MNLFVVTVTFDSNLPAVRPDDVQENGFSDAAQETFAVASPVADRAALDFLRWLRANSRQEWLGAISEPPKQYGRGGLYYASSGEGVMGIGPVQSYTIRSSRLRFEREALDHIGARVGDGDEIPVSDELLADAWHLSRGAAVPDIQRAVIVASIACEVRTQEAMRARVHADKAELLSVLLEKTSSPAFMLDTVMEAAFGVTLKQSDNALFKKVQALAAQRNSVVHEGKFTGKPFLGDPAQVATDLYAWLDEFVK